MKDSRLIKILATSTAGILAVSTVFAQTSSTTTTTNDGRGVATTTTRTTDMDGTGVVTAYTPGEHYVTFRSERETAPVRYYYTDRTTLVDPEGRAVEWSALRPDMPVRYTYVNEGGEGTLNRTVGGSHDRTVRGSHNRTVASQDRTVGGPHDLLPLLSGED